MEMEGRQDRLKISHVDCMYILDTYTLHVATTTVEKFISSSGVK